MSESVSELIAVLCDETSNVRGQAEYELANMGARAVDALIEVLRIDDHDTLLGIVSGVICAGHDNPLNRLYLRLYSLWRVVPESPRMRRAVNELACGKNLIPLLDLLKEANAEPRFYAMSALARIGTPAVAPLIASLGDGDDGLWSTSLIMLGLIGGDDAVRALIRNLKVPESRASYRISFRQVTDPREVPGPFSPAIFSLWYVGAIALPSLIEALDDEDEDIRLGAEIALEDYMIIDCHRVEDTLMVKGSPSAMPEVKALVEAGVPYSFITSGYFGISWLVPPALETIDRFPYYVGSRNHSLQRLKAFPELAGYKEQ